MELISSVREIFSATLVFGIGMLIAIKLAKSFGVTQKRSVKIYLWHTLFCFLYAQNVITNGGDAINYYVGSLSSNVEFSLGTDGVVMLTRLFSFLLGLSFLGVCLIFNIFGFIGLLAFDASLQAATWDKSKNIRRFATFLIFLPSVSFWSSGIGKDALSFMATGLALWCALNLRRRFLLMAIAIFVMLLVRPHIAALMVLATAFSMALQRKVSLALRALVGGVAFAGAILLVPFALNYSGLGGDDGATDLGAYIEERQGHNLEGGGAVDISSMSPPMQLFTYLFRPLPFEAHSVFSLAASLDNLVLLFLFLWGTREMIKRRKRQKQVFSENRIFLWAYSLSAWLILSLTTANLGISVRQKWMFAPMLIFLLISVIGRPRLHTAEQRASVLGSIPVQTSLRVNRIQKP